MKAMASSGFFILPILSLLCLLFTFTDAKEVLVGGKENSWTIPPSPDFLNLWAEKTRFKVGDFLIWKYDGNTDSVLEVTKEDYEGCKTSTPIKEYKDGNTKIELSRSGPYYFISGADGHCQKGEKVLVVVMSGKHKHTGGDSTPAPGPVYAPSPSREPNSAGRCLRVGFMVTIVTLVGLGLALF